VIGLAVVALIANAACFDWKTIPVPADGAPPDAESLVDASADV
jgi:hypothetical protein